MRKSADGHVKTVLHVSRVGYFGGAERVLVTIASGIETLGYRSIIACPPQGSLQEAAAERGLSVSTVTFSAMSKSLFPNQVARDIRNWRVSSKNLLRLAAKFGVKIIHVHHPVGALYSMRACRILNIPLVLHTHDILPISVKYRAALLLTSRYVSTYIAVSRPSVALLRSAGIGQERITLIHNGVDETFLTRATEEKFGLINPGWPNIAVFGVLEPRKGQLYFLRAAEVLVSAYPNARFWLVGASTPAGGAGYERSLHEFVSTSTLGERVVFAGYQKNAAALMREMDVVVLPSTSHESLPMTLIEAQVLGRPVVTTDVGGAREIVEDGVTGAVVNVRDFSALASAIQRSLTEEGKVMAKTGLDRAKLHFSPSQFCKRVANVYDQFC